MRIDVEGQVTNTSTTEPIYTTMAVLPFVDASVSTLTPQTVSNFPRAKVFMTGALNGQGIRRFKGSFPVHQYLGEENVGRTFFQDYSQAITSGVLGDLPAIYIGNMAAKIGNTWAGQFEIRFTMHLRYSGLNFPSLGLFSQDIRKVKNAGVSKTKGNEDRSDDDIADDVSQNRSWEDPTPSQKAAIS